MNIEYLHASKFGNGALVADEFKSHMTAAGVAVDVHPTKEMHADHPPPADLYLFSSPGRMGRPIGGMRRFLKKVDLPAGTKYAILTTEMGPPKPDKKTGRVPTQEEVDRYQKVRSTMNQILQEKGLVEVAEDKVYVTAMKGPLEDGWHRHSTATPSTPSPARFPQWASRRAGFPARAQT